MTFVQLFAGLGGAAYGLTHFLGMEPEALIEWDAVAAESLRRNFPDANVVEADVRGLDYSGLRPRVLIGGPPCQPFSQAADGTGKYDSRDMIPEFIRAVREMRPETFVMEEVQTLTWQRHRRYLDMVLEDLRRLGYTVEWRVLNASHYGVPQARKRLFVVGARTGAVQWPAPTGVVVTMAEALGWDRQEAKQRALAAPVYGDPSWVFERPSTTVVGSFRPDVQAAPGYRKAGDGPRQNTPGSVVITLREALVLQGLPAGWQVAGGEGKARLQVGNTVPAPLIASVVGANVKIEEALAA